MCFLLVFVFEKLKDFAIAVTKFVEPFSGLNSFSAFTILLFVIQLLLYKLFIQSLNAW